MIDEITFADIRNSDIFILLLTKDYYTEVSMPLKLKYAIGLKKPIYVLKQYDVALPETDLHGGDVRGVEEFYRDNEKSLEQAVRRLLPVSMNN